MSAARPGMLDAGNNYHALLSRVVRLAESAQRAPIRGAAQERVAQAVEFLEATSPAVWTSFDPRPGSRCAERGLQHCWSGLAYLTGPPKFWSTLYVASVYDRSHSFRERAGVFMRGVKRVVDEALATVALDSADDLRWEPAPFPLRENSLTPDPLARGACYALWHVGQFFTHDYLNALTLNLREHTYCTRGDYFQNLSTEGYCAIAHAEVLPGGVAPLFHLYRRVSVSFHQGTPTLSDRPWFDRLAIGCRVFTVLPDSVTFTGEHSVHIDSAAPIHFSYTPRGAGLPWAASDSAEGLERSVASDCMLGYGGRTYGKLWAVNGANVRLQRTRFDSKTEPNALHGDEHEHWMAVPHDSPTAPGPRLSMIMSPIGYQQDATIGVW